MFQIILIWLWLQVTPGFWNQWRCLTCSVRRFTSLCVSAGCLELTEITRRTGIYSWTVNGHLYKVLRISNICLMKNLLILFAFLLYNFAWLLRCVTIQTVLFMLAYYMYILDSTVYILPHSITVCLFQWLAVFINTNIWLFCLLSLFSVS